MCPPSWFLAAILDFCARKWLISIWTATGLNPMNERFCYGIRLYLRDYINKILKQMYDILKHSWYSSLWNDENHIFSTCFFGYIFSYFNSEKYGWSNLCLFRLKSCPHVLGSFWYRICDPIITQSWDIKFGVTLPPYPIMVTKSEFSYELLNYHENVKVFMTT